MSSIIEELYYGNITPFERGYGKESPFAKAAKLSQDNYDKLLPLLTEQGKEQFEKYCEAQTSVEGIVRYDDFTYALKFGILLMAEVFMGRSELF